METNAELLVQCVVEQLQLLMAVVVWGGWKHQHLFEQMGLSRAPLLRAKSGQTTFHSGDIKVSSEISNDIKLSNLVP